MTDFVQIHLGNGVYRDLEAPVAEAFMSLTSQLATAQDEISELCKLRNRFRQRHDEDKAHEEKLAEQLATVTHRLNTADKKLWKRLPEEHEDGGETWQQHAGELQSRVRELEEGLRPPLRTFAEAMELRLKSNDYKEPQWPDCETKYLLGLLRKKSRILIECEDTGVNLETFASHAIDAGNYALMLFDNANTLVVDFKAKKAARSGGEPSDG